MKRVTGIGGLFFKSKDPHRLKEWYARHLDIKAEDDGTVRFWWRDDENPEDRGCTVWSPFPHNTTYFEPSKASFMFNYRVADLDSLLEQLRKEGVTVEDRVEEYEYGRFGWIMDPEGNRIELWEPANKKH